MYWLYLMILLLLLVPLVAYICYRIAFFQSSRQKAQIAANSKSFSMQLPQRERVLALIDALEALSYEEVYISAQDGIRLFGRYYHLADGAPLEIQFHGYRGTAQRDFCGGFRLARDAGHNVLLVDQRAHGRSDGHTIAFGIKERFDCLQWVHYAVERFGPDVKILLSGVSMGAATVLMASALPLPRNVVGTIADCGYSSPEAIIRKVSRDMRLPDTLSWPFIRLGAWLFGDRLRISEFSALEAMKAARVPILFIHGEADNFVPCDMSREMFGVCTAPKSLLTVPNAGHGMSYILDTSAYTQAVNRFLDEVLG